MIEQKQIRTHTLYEADALAKNLIRSEIRFVKGFPKIRGKGIFNDVLKDSLSCRKTSGPLCPTVFKKNISTMGRRAHKGHWRTVSDSL